MSEPVPFQAVFNGRVPAPQLEANGTPRRGCLSLGWLLFGRGDRHLTAEMLYDEAMRAKVPVSLATVYNTLHQFTEAGLLRQLALDGSKAYFDTNPSEHHHFYLEDESQVIDMPDCGITVDSLPEAPEGMEIAGVEVIVRLRRARPNARRQS
jgi:Fur family transcriptional regulator, iron response regulator